MGLLVVTSTTPKAPRAPYTAVDEASLSTETDSTSCGLIALMLPSTPSIRTSVEPPAPIEPDPRTLTDAPRVGLLSVKVMFRPGNCPCKARASVPVERSSMTFRST